MSAFPSNRLTGRWRYRHGSLSAPRGFFARLFFGSGKGREALILQVEESYLHTSFVAGQVDCETRTRWRDASISDILASPPCKIARAGDSTWCDTCNKRWDTNDPAEPRCDLESIGIPTVRGQ